MLACVRFVAGVCLPNHHTWLKGHVFWGSMRNVAIAYCIVLDGACVQLVLGVNFKDKLVEM